MAIDVKVKVKATYKVPNGAPIMSDARKGIASVLETMTQERFDTRTDPNRKAWAQRRHTYQHPILDQTSDMRDSADTFVEGDTVAIAVQSDYASYHQNGTANIDARPFLPQDGEIPPLYAEAFDEVVIAALDDAFE